MAATDFIDLFTTPTGNGATSSFAQGGEGQSGYGNFLAAAAGAAIAYFKDGDPAPQNEKLIIQETADQQTVNSGKSAGTAWENAEVWRWVAVAVAGLAIVFMMFRK